MWVRGGREWKREGVEKAVEKGVSGAEEDGKEAMGRCRSV